MSQGKANKKHDFQGAGVFTYCVNCHEMLLDLGIPQRKCKGKS